MRINMGIWSFVTGIFFPVTDLIGKVVTKEEDVLKVQAVIKSMENEIASKLFEYESSLLDAKSKIIIADAQGASWLQRNWRPISMMTFLFLIVADAFNLFPFKLTKDAWDLLKIGLGGHIVSDAAARIAPHLSKRKS